MSDAEKKETKAKRKTIKSTKSATARKDAFAGDYIDLILAGRTKKVSVEIPHVELPASCFRPRKVILKQKDYDHLMGETDGTKYEYHGRPELDTLVVGLTDDYKVPQNLTENNAEITIQFDETRMVMFLYDVSKELYIMTDTVHARLVLLLHAALHASSSHPKPLPGPAPSSLGRIREVKKEDHDEHDGEHDERPPQKKQVLSILQSYSFIGAEKFYTTIDMIRLRVWRRFVHVHLQPLVEDEEEMRNARKMYAKEQKKLWKVRNNIPSDTDSTESTKSKKAKKGKKKGKGGSGKKDGAKKGKGGTKSSSTKGKKKAHGSDSESGSDSDEDSDTTSISSADDRKLSKEQIAAAVAKAAKVNMQHLNRRPLADTNNRK